MRHLRVARTANWTCRVCAPRDTRFISTATVSALAKGKEKPYFVTSPIFYVNAAPHIGHLYTIVLTDILKRWQELHGRPALLSTGTDEHGMKIQQAAAMAGSAPKGFCDEGAELFKILAGKANVRYDHFIRTTDAEHRDAVECVWERLMERGYLYAGKHEGWYSVSDETFYPESATQMALDPTNGRKMVVSTETGKELEWTSELNYHFRLSWMAERLLKFYASNPNFVVPAARHKEVVDAVERGLADLSVSRPRSRLSWCIPVPGDPEQTIYVWLDALVNYLTVSGYPWPPGREREGGWPADVHVIGKDIVRFHCIYWPAFLLALDIPLPKRVLAHAHWTMNRRKMSKSLGNSADPFNAMERYGVDPMRFYLAREGGLVDDGDYNNEAILEVYEKCLQGGLGNLAGRVRGKRFNLRGAVQFGSYRDQSLLQGLDKDQSCVLQELPGRVADKMERLEISKALKEITSTIFETNRYMQSKAPWRPDINTDDKHISIYLSAEAIRIAGILLQPFMPSKMAELLDNLLVAPSKRGFEHAILGGDVDYGVPSGVERTLLFPPLNEDSGM